MPPILESYNKIVALKAKPAPVLHDAQAFPGSIEIGIDQSCHPWINQSQWQLTHRFHGTLWGEYFGTTWRTVVPTAP